MLLQLTPASGSSVNALATDQLAWHFRHVSTRDFQFQQFRVRQSASAMKVCTDATVFGAMAPVTPGGRVLDIGTGTGLLALMAAQRGAASVDAVEIDPAAAAEAGENFAQSPWADRLRVIEGDICDPGIPARDRYDLILCNPPFFADQTESDDPRRRRARHADQGFLQQLVAVSAEWLGQRGLFYVLVPVSRVPTLSAMAGQAGLPLACRTDIQGFAHQSAKLAAVTFARDPGSLIERCLTVYDAPRQYSAQSTFYLRDFLLRFAARE